MAGALLLLGWEGADDDAAGDWVEGFEEFEEPLLAFVAEFEELC